MASELLHHFSDFIRESPSSYHAIRSVRYRLDAAGFTELDEASAWVLTPGRSYYVVRNGSSIIAFRLPEDRVGGFHIIASHSDSPTFKLKPKPVLTAENAPARLNVEAYGGMVRSSWFDRPLSVAGRVLVDAGERLEQRLVSFDRELLMMPSLAIHLSRDKKEAADGSEKKSTAGIQCPHCGKNSFLKKETVMDGWTKKGEVLKCAACGHPVCELKPEADKPADAQE